MTPYISYKTAKMLKEFLGESAPEPMGDYYFHEEYDQIETIEEWRAIGVEQSGLFPAYRLEDLLSREFCVAVCRRMGHTRPDGGKLSWLIWNAYYWYGGLPAVEHALAEMIGGE